MKTAKEMFEELGYVKNNLNLFSQRIGHNTTYSKQSDMFYYGVNFNLESKSVAFRTTVDDGGVQYLDSIMGTKLHLAIHQQMKELKWL